MDRIRESFGTENAVGLALAVLIGIGTLVIAFLNDTGPAGAAAERPIHEIEAARFLHP
jgi:hypothetical protein